MNVRSFFKTICILSVLFVLAGCKKDKSPVKSVEKEPEVEKDGVVTLYIRKDYIKLNGMLALEHMDSLLISETDHRIDIDNAVVFSADEIKTIAEFYFEGDFDGMADTVFYYWEYVWEINGKEQKETEAGRVRNHTTLVTLFPTHKPPAKKIQGLIFCLDKDNNNTGRGFVVPSFDGVPKDTLWIDAAQNTVCYTPHAAEHEFSLSDSTADLSIGAYDINSYLELSFGMMWFLQSLETEQIYGISSGGIGFNVPDLDANLKVVGFAPNFLQLK